MINKLFRLTFTAAALALTLGAAPSSRAGMLTYDGFTQDTTGASNNNIVGQGGGTGWSGNWQSGQSDGFVHVVRTPTAIAYTGYTSSTTPAASGGNYLNVATGFGGSNPTGVFRGFDVSVGGNYGTNGYLNGGLIGADNTVLWGSILYSNDDIKTGTSAKTLGLTGGDGFVLTLPQPSASNLLVYRINFNPGAADTVTYFSNPNLATFNGTTGAVTSAVGNYAFNTLVLTEQGTGAPGNSGTEGQYDDIRFGTTLADVVPVPAPEPSTYAMIGLGAIAACAYRRRIANA